MLKKSIFALLVVTILCFLLTPIGMIFNKSQAMLPGLIGLGMLFLGLIPLLMIYQKKEKIRFEKKFEKLKELNIEKLEAEYRKTKKKE